MGARRNIYDSFLIGNVHSVDELNALDSDTETIVVENKSCNDEDFTDLDLTRFTNLTSLVVGDLCFEHVKTMIVVGLDNLETIKIGMDSFKGYTYSQDSVFSVKNCSRLRELKIGPSSFRRWSIFEIEDVPSLEVIEIGYVHYDGVYDSFDYASLELKSGFGTRE